MLGLSQAPGLGGWRPVIADIARQLTTAMPDAQWRFSIYDDTTRQLLHHGITLARPQPDQTTETGFTAADVAFVRARDRTCRAPHGCTVPATTCDTDHTLAKVDGGGHDRDNAGPLCKRDHRFNTNPAPHSTNPNPAATNGPHPSDTATPSAPNHTTNPPAHP